MPRDARGPGRRPGEPAAVLVDGEWAAVGTARLPRRDRSSRPGGGRAAAALPGAAAAHACRRQRARGPVQLRPAHRGRSRRAGRGGGRVPGSAARRHRQGPGGRGRRRGRRRRAGGARGDEDGAHAAGRRRGHGGPGALRARATRSTWTTCWWPWSRRERRAGRLLRVANCSGFFGDRLPPPARWSRAGRSTCSPATGWPS